MLTRAADATSYLITVDGLNGFGAFGSRRYWSGCCARLATERLVASTSSLSHGLNTADLTATMMLMGNLEVEVVEVGYGESQKSKVKSQNEEAVSPLELPFDF